ncbi:unnamed protein product [Paramecium sonneborni]|uniref:Uncharacterized protein n=1 Tax=Paramecium sonneborni TaxID=65129 RepID=A0A8S1M686_9CILI|nr:unnamed protein product [Paramecium sonneborni]
MKQIQYEQILRASQEIQLRDKFAQLSSKAHEFVRKQIKQLESNYNQQISTIFEQYYECKMMCDQLKFKNEQYAKLILEQEFKSIQTKNYVCLEIVNQLLTQKINSLLMQLKNHNIISESEYFSQRNLIQMSIAEVIHNTKNQAHSVQENQNLENCENYENYENHENLEPAQILPSFSKQESQSQLMNFKKAADAVKFQSVGTQTKIIQKKEKFVNQSKIQNLVRQSPSPDIDRELLECKKSIKELQKSKIDLQANNEFLKSQNYNLLTKLNKKQKNQFKCDHNVIKNTNTSQAHVIKKFLKFDDILFKNVTSFQMAQSFDLRQGSISSRQFFSRPRTSAPNSTRNRFNSTQQPSRSGFHVLL